MYEPTTGQFIWPRRVGRDAARWNSRYAGKPAGTIGNHGYLAIKINKKTILAHRLAWFLTYGSWPENHIDHINGNRADNRPANLRAVTNAQNIAHRTRQNRNNTSGHPGVYWHKAAGKWAACIKRNRTTHHLGLFDQIEEAVAVVVGDRPIDVAVAVVVERDHDMPAL